MGLIPEDIVNRHDLYITTNTDFTYTQSTMVSNSGKSTIDLTLTRGLKNIKVVPKDFTLIKTRHKAIKSNAKFINESKDSTQFWHRYDKVLGKKTNNIVEPIYDTESDLHIFNDKKISEKLQKFYIEKIGKNEFDLQFKHEIEKEIDSVLELNQTRASEIFFNITHIKQAIKNSNKNSAPGPDRITVELVQNGGEHLFHCLTHLMQASYFLRYFPKPLKKENRIYLKKT